MEVTEAMWEAAGEKFYEKLPIDCGLSDEKYSTIKSLLVNWDDLSPADRRDRSGGNHIFWSKKYQVVEDRLCYKVATDDALDIKQVSCVETILEDIKSVHFTRQVRDAASHCCCPVAFMSRALTVCAVYRESQQGQRALQGRADEVRQ